MNVGGPAIQVCTISKGLPEKDFEQLLLTGKCESDEIDYLELNRIVLPTVEVVGLGRSISFLGDLKALLFLRKQLQGFKPDIIHTHTFKAGALGRIASFAIRPKPLRIHTFHGHLLEGYLKGAKLWILLQIERFLARKTHLLVSVGRKVMDDLITHGVGKTAQFRIIPPGFPIDRSLEKKALPRSLSERNSEFRFVWVGRFVDIKRPERIVEIARLLKEKVSPIRILMVGDGHLRKDLESQCIRERLPVTFMGWQSDIHKILAGVDALILTSANEGTPISIIEAQRLGKPVVATDVGSVSEVMVQNESGFVLDYSVNGFVEKLELLARNNNLYLQFSDKAKKFSFERFSAERLVNDHVKLYQELINISI
jgi:glycosyltransferase involved in cell wall biosynthesis